MKPPMAMPIMAPVGSPLWEDLEEPLLELGGDVEESDGAEMVVVPVVDIDTVTNIEVIPDEDVVTAEVEAALEVDTVGVVEERLELPATFKNGHVLGTDNTAVGIVRGLCRS